MTSSVTLRISSPSKGRHTLTIARPFSHPLLWICRRNLQQLVIIIGLRIGAPMGVAHAPNAIDGKAVRPEVSAHLTLLELQHLHVLPVLCRHVDHVGHHRFALDDRAGGRVRCCARRQHKRCGQSLVSMRGQGTYLFATGILYVTSDIDHQSRKRRLSVIPDYKIYYRQFRLRHDSRKRIGTGDKAVDGTLALLCPPRCPRRQPGNDER